jgi:hypothetical protein
LIASVWINGENTLISLIYACIYKKLRHAAFFALWLVVLLLAPVEGRGGAVALQVENDLFSLDDHDRYYTHGTKLSWTSGESAAWDGIAALPPWMQHLATRFPLVNDPGAIRSLSFSLVQEIYTPDNKRATALLASDRPYAGLAYLGFGLHGRNARYGSVLEIDVGIVGRHAYAEDCQQAIHSVIHEQDPRGWASQLADEPVLNLYGERRWKAVRQTGPGGAGFDVIPYAALAAGNAFTGATLGGELRLGWNIPDNLGTYMSRRGMGDSIPADGRDLGIHFFMAAEGKYVLRNILLDGNTFRDTPSVSKKPFVADIVGGIGLDFHRFRIAYAYVLRTKEFDLQKDNQQFGRITILYTF